MTQGGGDPAQWARQLEMIRGSAAELLTTAERVSDLARLGAEPPGESSAFDCRPVVTEVAEALRPAAAERGRRIVTGIPPEPVGVTGDPDDLRRLLVELVDNAVKYGDGTELHLDVRRDSATPEIDVRDDGPGIAPDELGRVLRPFERGAAAHERGETGTGLGLCIAARLATRSGARLAMHSGPAGTRATVTLVATQAPEQPGQSEHPWPPSSSSTTAPPTGR